MRGDLYVIFHCPFGNMEAHSCQRSCRGLVLAEMHPLQWVALRNV